MNTSIQFNPTIGVNLSGNNGTKPSDGDKKNKGKTGLRGVVHGFQQKLSSLTQRQKRAEERLQKQEDRLKNTEHRQERAYKLLEERQDEIQKDVNWDLDEVKRDCEENKEELKQELDEAKQEIKQLQERVETLTKSDEATNESMQTFKEEVSEQFKEVNARMDEFERHLAKKEEELQESRQTRRFEMAITMTARVILEQSFPQRSCHSELANEEVRELYASIRVQSQNLPETDEVKALVSSGVVCSRELLKTLRGAVRRSPQLREIAQNACTARISTAPIGNLDVLY